MEYTLSPIIINPLKWRRCTVVYDSVPIWKGEKALDEDDDDGNRATMLEMGISCLIMAMGLEEVMGVAATAQYQESIEV